MRISPDARIATLWIAGLIALGIAVNAVAIVKRAQGAERCIGSIYSTKDKDQPGTRTASGIPLNDRLPSIAHKTLPLKSYARVTNHATGQSAVFHVTDRGPFVAGRCVDFSVAAGRAVGCSGLCPVTVVPL